MSLKICGPSFRTFHQSCQGPCIVSDLFVTAGTNICTMTRFTNSSLVRRSPRVATCIFVLVRAGISVYVLCFLCKCLFLNQKETPVPSLSSKGPRQYNFDLIPFSYSPVSVSHPVRSVLFPGLVSVSTETPRGYSVRERSLSLSPPFITVTLSVLVPYLRFEGR